MADVEGTTMTFGERLYQLRSEKNLSQEQLAELLDVSRQSISKWENDKAYPEMTRLLFLSDYFQVSLDYLMRGTEEKQAAAGPDEKYEVEKMVTIWNSFVSNLSGKQRKLLYVLIICVLTAIVLTFVYEGGYAAGQFLRNLQNGLGW